MARLDQAKNILRYIEEDVYTFICNAIRHEYNVAPFELFPELKQFKPAGKNLYGGWFDNDSKGRQQRIKVLNKLIKILEDETT